MMEARKEVIYFILILAVYMELTLQVAYVIQ